MALVCSKTKIVLADFDIAACFYMKAMTMKLQVVNP